MLSTVFRKLISLTRSDDLPVVRCGERVWHVTASGVELFGPGGPDIDLWIANGSAVLVKTNPARTVYRVDLSGGTVFIKHCKITGLRAWAREVIRLPKARLEFENSLALRERNIPAVEPLAWGHLNSQRPGESYLITRGHTAAVPFLHYLEHILPTLPPDEYCAICRQIACELGRFLARLHDAGVTHPDPHPGNLLLELPPCRIPRFALIDLHAIQIGKPLGWARSRDNLVLFNRWFQLRSSRTDRARFWQAYRRARKQLPTAVADTLRAGAMELERETVASNLRFWAAREDRCLQLNRHFQKVHQGKVRGWAVRDLSAAFLQGLLANPDAPFASHSSLEANEPDSAEHCRQQAKLLKDSPTSTVVEMTMPGPDGPVTVVLKRVNVRSWVTPIKNLIRLSPVLRSWINGHALRDRRLSTPRPLATFHRYRNGLPAEGYLLTEKVPGAVAIDVAISSSVPLVREIPREIHLRRSSETDRSKAEFAEVSVTLARLLRAMHDRDVSHRDLKAANILLANSTQPMLIDLVGVRTQVRLTNAQRAKELARLNASFINSPHVNRTDRLRFLRAYLSAGPGLGVGW
ncbi:MAG TPA: lipopolysaccharide kinase InaA family protein, partial [Gemmata sp.]|nr:lipopolysaccharide kinase InaA family protein [Gemmata sp.]